MITQGDFFPEFKIQGTLNDKEREYTRDDFKGKWTFLFFYPEDFSFICPTEVRAFESERNSLEEKGGQVFGVSVDDIASHNAWAKELNLNYPLLSDTDFNLSKKLGVLDDDNRSKRATFIISPDLKVEFLMVTSRNIGRSVNETIRIFDAIQSGRMCPVDFKVN